MAEEKKLTFKIHKDKGELRDPRWREAEVENAKCPKCVDTDMVVVFGHNQMLYAYCCRCGKYFVGE